MNTLKSLRTGGTALLLFLLLCLPARAQQLLGYTMVEVTREIQSNRQYDPKPVYGVTDEGLPYLIFYTERYGGKVAFYFNNDICCMVTHILSNVDPSIVGEVLEKQGFRYNNTLEGWWHGDFQELAVLEYKHNASFVTYRPASSYRKQNRNTHGL